MKKSAKTQPVRPTPLPISSRNLPANILASAAARTFAEVSASADASTPAPLADALRLRREDLLGMEPLLAALLRRVLPFATHSLYFPTPANTPEFPQWLAKERTLLLPLVRQGEVLGVFTARGVDGRATRRLLPELPALVELCLDNLELERRGRCDALTGLALGRELLRHMAREADMVRQRFSGGGDDMGPLHRACMGLVVVRCRDWHALAAETNHAFAESLLVELSQALTRDLPPEALAARTGDDEFAVLLSAGSRGACRRLAAALLPRLDAVSQAHPITRRTVRICCSIGHALYPQDMEVALLPLPMEEQARTLLHKARLAATAAQERFDALLEQDAALGALHAEEGREARAMAFGRVLHEGGVIRRALPMGRAETSLGRHMGACEGLRFAVWSQSAGPHTTARAEGPSPHPAPPQPLTATRRCKGEIILVEVREKASVADIVHWTDPADGPDKGDILTLLPQDRRQTRGQTSEEIPPRHAPHVVRQNGTPLNDRLSDEQLAQQPAQQLAEETHALSRKPSRKLSNKLSSKLSHDLTPELSRELAHGLAPELAPELTRELAHDLSRELAHGLAPELAHTPPHNATSTPAPTAHTAAHTTKFTTKPATTLSPEVTQAQNTPALLRHGDFVRQLGRHCEGRAAFSLVLVRLCNAPLNGGLAESGHFNDAPLNGGLFSSTSLDRGSLDRGSLGRGSLDNAPLDNAPLDNAPLDNAPLNDAPLNGGLFSSTSLDSTSLDNAPLDRGSFSAAHATASDSQRSSQASSAPSSHDDSSPHHQPYHQDGNQHDNSRDNQRDSRRDSAGALEARMFRLHQLCRQHFAHEGAQLTPVLSAHYGQTSLIFLHSAAPASTVKAETSPTHTAYAKLCRAAAAEGLDVAVGLAAWPHLRFTRADMPECCRKALDLALLLPEPRVGVFGSLALHISADKRYSRGDIFGAVEEYKLALLADRNNSMAWNSLGVCMAALARQQEARGHFLKALQGWKRALRTQSPPPFLPADTTLAAEFAATLYNLGTVCQALGERRAAAHHFRQCVEMQPEHYFAHLRLGQLAEEGQRNRKAREHYAHALNLEDSGLQSGGMARRHLARLAVRGRKLSQARELLHEALRRDPHDAAAMGMLAELCLDGGEDPAMAEMLARTCVSLRQTHAPSWRLLARALRALDRHPEADAAEARAGGI